MTNMTGTASGSSSQPDEQGVPADVLDALVPPSGSRWRRVVAWMSFGAAIVAAGWVWSLGIANPEISSRAATWGGDGPVHIGFQINSESPVALEITEGFDVPPGLRLLGYSTAPFDPDARLQSVRDDVFPYRLAAGETVGLTAFYEVDDCAALPRGGVDVEVTVAIADGPFSRFTHHRQIGEDLFVGDDGSLTSWPMAVAAFVCGAGGE